MSRFSQLNQIIQGPFVVHRIREACGVSLHGFIMSREHYYSVHREGHIHIWAQRSALLDTIESLNHVKTN